MPADMADRRPAVMPAEDVSAGAKVKGGLVFSIRSEPACRLVRIKIDGMLTLADVTDLYHQEHAAVLAMGCKLGEHLALVDLTGCALQLQDVVAAFRTQIRSVAQARKLALVTGASAVRMQARRILDRREAALFETIADAENWLLDAA